MLILCIYVIDLTAARRARWASMSGGTLWNRGAIDNRNRPDTGICNRHLEGCLRVPCEVVCPTILFWRSGVVKRVRLPFQIVFSRSDMATVVALQQSDKSMEWLQISKPAIGRLN